MGLRVLGGFGQLINDVLGRRQVGVAHTEVDNVFAGGAEPRLHGVHFREHIGRQTFDTVELGLHRKAYGI